MTIFYVIPWIWRSLLQAKSYSLFIIIYAYHHYSKLLTRLYHIIRI